MSISLNFILISSNLATKTKFSFSIGIHSSKVLGPIPLFVFLPPPKTNIFTKFGDLFHFKPPFHSFSQFLIFTCIFFIFVGKPLRKMKRARKVLPPPIFCDRPAFSTTSRVGLVPCKTFFCDWFLL